MDISSFWAGRPLSYLEQLCLKSFADHGHNVSLYCYETEMNVPPGVTLRNARDIIPDARMLDIFSGIAPFSDVFRVNLIAQTRCTWVDCDVVSLGSLPTDETVFARAKRHVSNAVLRLPPTSKTLAHLLEMLNAKRLWLPIDWRWKGQIPKEAIIQVDEAEGKIFLDNGQLHDLPYLTFGPHALHYCLSKTGEMTQQMPTHRLYPINAELLAWNYGTPHAEPIRLPDDSMTLHHVGGRPFFRTIRRLGLSGTPHPESLIGQLCAKHGIDPDHAPLPKGLLRLSSTAH